MFDVTRRGNGQFQNKMIGVTKQSFFSVVLKLLLKGNFGKRFLISPSPSGPEDFWSATDDQEGRSGGASPPPRVPEPVQPGACHERTRGGALVPPAGEHHRHLPGGGKQKS